MIDKRDFLNVVAGYADSPVQGPKPSTSRPIRLGAIDPYYTAGLARVLFDGETVLSNSTYPWVNGYSPVPGERVFLLPVGQSYLIGGAIDTSIPYAKYHNIPLASNFDIYNDTTFHAPSFTKTVSGVVKLTGLVKHTSITGTLTSGTLIGTLPEGFRPDRNMAFPCMTGANLVGVVEVLTDGRILSRNNAQGAWISLAHISFQTADLSWTQLAYMNNWGMGSINPGTRALEYTKDELDRIWVRGNFGNALADKTTDTAVFSTPAGFRPSPQSVYAAGANVDGGASGFSHHFWNTTTGDFTWRMGSAEQNEISVDGIISPPSGASWITPTLTNSWVSFGASNTPGYWKDSEGVVHLRGLVKTGTINTPIFTLPNGYRPLRNVIRVTPSNGLQARLDVTSAGAVQAVTGSNAWVSLDSVFFTAEQ